MTRPPASPSLPSTGLSHSAGGHVVSVVAPSAAETTVSAALFAAATVAEASLAQIAAHASAFAQAPPAAQVLAAELQHQLLRREGCFVEGDLDHGGDVLGLGASGEDRLVGADTVGLGTAVDAHKGALLHTVHALAERGQGVCHTHPYGSRSPLAQLGRLQHWPWEQQDLPSSAGSTAGARQASVQAGIVGVPSVEQEEEEVMWLWNQSGAAIEYKTAER